MNKQVLILGGGYGGLLSALTVRKYLKAGEADVTLVNRYPEHQLVTELHRLAAGNVKEQAVALPLEKLLRGQEVRLKIGTAENIDPVAKLVRLADRTTLRYDTLVIALGSETAFFGIPGLAENSFTLKSVDDAKRIRAHLESKLDAYARTKEDKDASIVVGGGGLTGVEAVGELADELPDWCRARGIEPEDIRLYCVEAGPSILAGFPPELVDRARESLESRGVRFVTGQPVTEVRGTEIVLRDGTSIEAGTLIWAGGVQGHPVVSSSGIELSRGRAVVTECLQSVSHPDIFVAGDSAIVLAEDGRPYPPSAQLAWQMGETAGFNIFASFRQTAMKPFRPVMSGTLASLGRRDGVATIGARRIPLKGFPASAMKEASHIRYLSHIKGLFSLAY
ncbi:pyridine nucleotide-disulfide oxidoreductase [Cohnella sp. CFH 77786]|uniref:NAD(P)/FAD-dependent oxidoreductase n=1 Tax=Cohnella sp. CFH 77786 TaxID=2662265 RepID=UPI001C60BAA3|nr:NAD(P)/FAD-dependent oxidoreductase [Cohnella sp. CFH 77786]MBW5448282.1 pyridine nucleotide-disulfide oxidoreductase [Cohnella sp. CFH 77786]